MDDRTAAQHALFSKAFSRQEAAALLTAATTIAGPEMLLTKAAQGGRTLAMQNQMFKGALAPWKNSKYTKVGRALNKHPNIVGAQTAGDLSKMFGNQSGVNAAAAAALKGIMRNAARTTKNTKSYGMVVDYKMPTGTPRMGARFNARTGEFIGFLGR